MANKTFIDLDLATPASGDFFPFWDTSAGGARKVGLDDFAGILAGQGLTANGGKVDLGGGISSFQSASILLDVEGMFEIKNDDQSLSVQFIDISPGSDPQISMYCGNTHLSIDNTKAYLEASEVSGVASIGVGGGEGAYLKWDFSYIAIFNDELTIAANVLSFNSLSSAGAPANAPTHKLLVTLDGLPYEIAASPV